MAKKDVLIVENLADFEKLVNKDFRPYDINMMVLPGTLEDKHKDVDPEKGIRALRRQFNLIYLLTSGEHDVQLGADQRWLKPNDLVIVPENMVYASKFIRNCKGFCIHFKTEFIQSLLSGVLSEDFPFFEFEAEHIINLTESETQIISDSFLNIIKEYQNFSHEKEYILKHSLQILLLRIREIYRPKLTYLQEHASRTSRIANQFKHLVEKHFITTREVNVYASKLNITPKYLCDVVKDTFGKTPRKLINDFLLLESKVQLGSTDKSISEIAHQLQFEDPSHFSHFIKQHTGFSPQVLRQKL